MDDDSSPDYNGSNVDAGSPVQPCHDDPSACTLTSQTFMDSPADRTRLKVGAGEQVTLTYAPGDATWSVAGDGAISFNDGDDSTDSTVFTAGDTAGAVTITANGDNGSCSLTFNVVVPSYITMYKQSGTPLKHTKGFAENGFLGLAYLHPNDVNFYRVMVREKDSLGVGTGRLSWIDGVFHSSFRSDIENYTLPDAAGGANVSEWVSLVNHTDAYGTNTGTQDHIWCVLGSFVPDNAAALSSVGDAGFTIIWQWQVTGKTTVTNFPAIHQLHTVFTNGKMQSKKGGDNRSSLYDDDTTTPPGWPDE